MDGFDRDKYLSFLSQANGFKCYMYENLSNTLSIRYRFIAKKAILKRRGSSLQMLRITLVQSPSNQIKELSGYSESS